MIFCEQCGNQLKDEAKFCGKCGTPVGAVQEEAPPQASAPTACAQCGTPLDEDEMFCANCGAKVGDAYQPVADQGQWQAVGGEGVADEVSVLIVDDSAMMRNIISHMVEETPGLVIAEKAMNGLFALQKISQVNPDVIALDLEMPEMSGIEFLKERKKRGIEIPVIILSSIKSQEAEITMALSLGASDFVQKPSGSESEDINVIKDTLVGMLLGYGSAYRNRKT